MEIKQTADETVHAFYERFEEAAGLVSPDEDVNSNQYHIAYFESNLRPIIYSKYRDSTSGRNIATLEEAKLIAVECEQLLNSKHYQDGILAMLTETSGWPEVPTINPLQYSDIETVQLDEKSVPFFSLTPSNQLFTAGGVPRPLYNDEAIIMLSNSDWNKWIKLHKPVQGKMGSVRAYTMALEKYNQFNNIAMDPVFLNGSG